MWKCTSLVRNILAEYAENESKKDCFFFLLCALYSSDEQFYLVGDILKVDLQTEYAKWYAIYCFMLLKPSRRKVLFFFTFILIYC